MLQCGRGRMTAENGDVNVLTEVVVEASMRPRSDDRGEQRTRRIRLPVDKASMRPRSDDRGERDWLNRCNAGGALQCGRGRMTAENEAHQRARRAAVRCFNAAAVG